MRYKKGMTLLKKRGAKKGNVSTIEQILETKIGFIFVLSEISGRIKTAKLSTIYSEYAPYTAEKAKELSWNG